MRKLIICDLDGCLNYYPDIKLDFVNDFLQKNVFNRFRTLNDMRDKLPKEQYKELTALYRYSDYKHNAQVNWQLVRMIESLGKTNADKYIITARSDDDDMKAMTRQWAKKTGLADAFWPDLHSTVLDATLESHLIHTEDKRKYVQNLLDWAIEENNPYTNVIIIDDNLGHIYAYDYLLKMHAKQNKNFHYHVIWVKHKNNKHYGKSLNHQTNIITYNRKENYDEYI